MTIGVIFAFLVGSLQLNLGGQAAMQGRAGNSHLKVDEFEEASAAYQNGLNAYANGRSVDDTYFGLQNNLGVSLFRQDNFEQAQAAFDAALAHAPSDIQRARAAYNAGNTAFNQQAAEAALAHYQNALLANPDDQDAKFNFEYVKRWIQQQEQQDQQQNNDEEQDNQEQDQNQENQQGQQQQDEQQPDQQQESEQQQPQQSEEENQSDAQPQESRDTQLTRQQAEQILEALENEEQELLRQVQKVQGVRRRVAKDW